MNKNGTLADSNSFLYYDSTVEYYGEDHLPFAGVSICVVLVFIVFPTLLLILYPTRIFRKCITCCRFRRWHALHTFMEAFQGQYKDGTNGTRDFRMVSALYLVFRIAVLFGFSSNHDMSFNHAYIWLATAVAFVCTSLFFAIVRPYKVNSRNTTDTLLLAMLNVQILMIIHVCKVLAKAKVQPCDRNDRVANIGHSTCCTCIVHPVHHIKEDQNSSGSE